MYRYIRLNKNIDCNYICKVVNELLTKYSQSKQITANSLITIHIQDVDNETNLTTNIEYIESHNS